jgi:hypothetical protein
MNQIASKRTEQDVKQEALSIMNIIVMSTDAYTARESFVSKEVFESISLLLRKEGGLHVRKEAIHLFYLLLNCKYLLEDHISWFYDEAIFAKVAFLSSLIYSLFSVQRS